MDRHFYRCWNCCYVFALEGFGRRNGVTCDCGGAKASPQPWRPHRVEWIGKVVGESIIASGMRCPCDHRCTEAAGPCCSCSCGGANHGTGKLVLVVTNIEGIPELVSQTSESRKLEVKAFECALERAREIVSAHPLVKAKISGHWLDRSEYTKALNLINAIPNICKLKTMAGRMKALAKIK